jgi:hypothetical protein
MFDDADNRSRFGIFAGVMNPLLRCAPGTDQHGFVRIVCRSRHLRGRNESAASLCSGNKPAGLHSGVTLVIDVRLHPV